MDLIKQSYLPKVISVAREAAEAVLQIYSQKIYQVESKLDNSPVTEADLLANNIIKMGLNKIDPSLPFLSEEDEIIPFEERVGWSRYWLVDPLDGTREFLAGTGEFTINIALVEDHQPVLGVILAPVLKRVYWAEKGQGAYKMDFDGSPLAIATHQESRSPLKVVVSRRFHEKKNPLWNRLENKLGLYETLICGSALKICMVASGEADLYPRIGPTGEWDTAAGQCILEEAGGQLVDSQGYPLSYNTKASLENPLFYAIAAPYLLPLVVDNS